MSRETKYLLLGAVLSLVVIIATLIIYMKFGLVAILIMIMAIMLGAILLWAVFYIRLQHNIDSKYVKIQREIKAQIYEGMGDGGEMQKRFVLVLDKLVEILNKPKSKKRIKN